VKKCPDAPELDMTGWEYGESFRYNRIYIKGDERRLVNMRTGVLILEYNVKNLKEIINGN